MRNLFATESDYTLTIARLTLGVVFFAHGAQKLLGCFGGYGYTGTMGFFVQQLGIPMPLAFLAICAEFFGGLGLIVGLFGRVAALGISVNMLVAIARIHRHFGFFANWSGTQKGEGYEFHLLAVALAVLIVIKGSGAFAIDNLLAKVPRTRLSTLTGARNG